MSKARALDSDEIAAALDQTSETVVNSPFASPDRDDYKNDPNYTDDDSNESIFASPVKVSSTAEFIQNSALSSICNPPHKSIVTSSRSSFLNDASPSRGKFSNDARTQNNTSSSYFDSYPSVTFFGNNSRHSSLKSNYLDPPRQKSDVDPQNFFKLKSNFKPLEFDYESSKGDQQSDFFKIGNLPLDKAGVEATKAYDNWVCRYLKKTNNLEEGEKLSVIDTSQLNAKFDKAKITNDSGSSGTGANKKNQKSNGKAPANNGKKIKNQNQNSNDKSSLNNSCSPSPFDDNDGWRFRNKEKFEKFTRTSSDFRSSFDQGEEVTSAKEEDPYSFKSEDLSPEISHLTRAEKEPRKLTGKQKPSTPEVNNSKTNVEVEFTFASKIMDEKDPVIKPSHGNFREALLRQGQGHGFGRGILPKSPVLDDSSKYTKGRSNISQAETLCREKTPVLVLRAVDKPNEKQFQRSSEVSSVVTQNNEQFCDKENEEETYPCPICEKQFKTNDIQNHANSCLDTEPPQTRSREQAHASGKKRPLEYVDPEDLTKCDQCDQLYHRRGIKEHQIKCLADFKIYNISSSDDESNSIAPKIQRIE